MKTLFSRIFTKPWYFIAIAAFPVLALLNYNIPQIRFTAGIRSLFLSIAAAVGFFLLLRLLFRNSHRAAFATAGLTVLFYTYGQVYDYIVAKKWPIPHLTAWLGGLWIILAGLSMVWAGRRRSRLENAALTLNIVSAGLVIVSIVQIVWWSVPVQAKSPVDDYADEQKLKIPPGQIPPDIYYIIPDSYGRSDLLKTAFQYDNSSFISNLEIMGFYVAECSQSNYNRTDVSLASSLNMDYLQYLDDDFKPGRVDRRTLWDSISHSTVRYELEEAGYKTIAFATGFAWSEITDADEFLAPSPVWSAMTGFETMLLRTTPGRHLEDLNLINLDQIEGRRYRERTQLILNSMVKLATMPGPKFVFIHIISPHPPFIYSPEGLNTDPALYLNEDRLYTADTYTRGYRNQVEYISTQLENAVSTLLADSSQPPVIIIQGDHGPWLQSGYKKFTILNAYYFPNNVDLLYPTISPVNSFRLILNSYLGANYPLLEDKSYYSPIPKIYEFQETPNPCLSD